MRIVLIGAGNLATNLGKALFHAGHEIVQVYSRTEASAKILASVLKCTYTDTLEDVTCNADIYIVAVKPAVVQKALEDGKLISSNQNIPAPLHAAIARSIYDLIAALSERQEKHWFIYDKILTKYWERKGPYLFPKVAKEKYSDFMLHCLNLGIVISPDYAVPSIVPFGADTGVFTALKNNPFEL